jgi:hypothetical protein
MISRFAFKDVKTCVMLPKVFTRSYVKERTLARDGGHRFIGCILLRNGATYDIQGLPYGGAASGPLISISEV